MKGGVGWGVKFWRGENEASLVVSLGVGKTNKDSSERWNESERGNERMGWAGLAEAASGGRKKVEGGDGKERRKEVVKDNLG